MLNAFCQFVLSLFVTAFRAFTLKLLFGMLIAPAFGLPAISIFTAWGIMASFQLINSSQLVGVLKGVMAIVWGPSKDASAMESYLKQSKGAHDAGFSLALVLEAAVVIGLAYVVGFIG